MTAPRSPIRIDPALLRWARESSGLDPERAAKKIGVQESRLAEWESAERHPTPRQLENIADAYKRPLATFFMPEPPREPPMPVDFRTLPSDIERRLSEDTVLAARRARWLQRIYGELEERSTDSSAAHLRRISLDRDPEIVGGEVRRQLGVAIEEQLSWRLPDKALKAWRGAIEKQGVVVFQFGMPVEEVRGFSLSDGPVPVIVLSTRDAPAARVFTLFHEFAHLLVRKSGICNPNQGMEVDQDQDVEIYCNVLAGAALVPASDLRNVSAIAEYQAGRLSLESSVEHTARAFSVSRFVILRRLLFTRMITADTYKSTAARWMRQPAAASKKLAGGPSPAAIAVSQLGGTFVSRVLAAHQSGRLSVGEVSDCLSIRVKHLDGVYELMSGGGSGPSLLHRHELDPGAQALPFATRNGGSSDGR